MSNALISSFSPEQGPSSLCSLSPISNGFGMSSLPSLLRKSILTEWVLPFKYCRFWPRVIKSLEIGCSTSLGVVSHFLTYKWHSKVQSPHWELLCFDLEPLLTEQFGYWVSYRLAKCSSAPFFNSNKNPWKCILMDSSWNEEKKISTVLMTDENVLVLLVLRTFKYAVKFLVCSKRV